MVDTARTNGTTAGGGAPREAAALAGPSQAGVHQVVERLLLAHEAWYDVTRDAQVYGRRFAGLAAFHQHGERYVLSRRAKLWGVATHEYVLFDDVDALDAAALSDYLDFMRTRAVELVDPDEPDHMSTNLGLVLVAGRADPEALRLARSTRWRKNYRLGLSGWSDLRVAVVDLSGQGERRVVTNAAGKGMRATIGSALGGTAQAGPARGGTRKGREVVSR